MKNKTTIIRGEGKRYLGELPEFKEGLPFGIINKRLTDVGGTFVAMNCPHNYIAVVPFRDLATSIESDVNNKYEVFKLYGGVTKTSFREYVERAEVKKIVVTYDSLKKLIIWLRSIGESLDDYKVLVDEYHLILEDLDFRDEAINNVLELVTEFPHYSFLSATPINTDFEFDFFKNLPHYEVDWGKTQKISPLKIKTPNVYKATVALINNFKEGLELDTIHGTVEQVEELHIFINSVKGIAQICQSAGLEDDEIRIICADRIRNNMILDKYTVGSISDENAKINFYTKKGFQGCNIFSNNALVVVVSDAKTEHTLVDIETTLVQIVGRIRVNKEFENVFRHKIYHIFSTNKRIMTDEEFNTFIENKREESEIIFNDLMSKDTDVRALFIQRMNFESDFISVNGGDVYFNERKEQLFRYKHNLKKSYRDGLTVRQAYNSSDKFIDTKQMYSKFDDIVLTKIVDVKLEDLYQMFLEAEDKEVYELEYPEFFEYQEYLTVSEMNTARWNKKKIDKLLSDKKLLRTAHKRVYDLITDGFVSSADIKQLYTRVFKELKISLNAKGTLIEDNKFMSVESARSMVNGKQVRGYEINKILFRFA